MSDWSSVQNLVFPLDRDPDVLPLYVDPDTWARIGDETVRVSARSVIDDVLSRTGLHIGSGKRVSFCTYFNAFPASYWQHWTTVDEVRLTIATQGPGTLLVYRSNSQGVQQSAATRTVAGDSETVIDLPVTGFGDGGWYWFDVVAESKPIDVISATWSVRSDQPLTGKVSLAITTFDKPDYCLATLKTLESSPQLRQEVDRIFLVDQGSRHVSDEPGFDDVAGSLGDTLKVIRQANLGGSGGFSRGMAETLDRPDSDFVLLLDDDVQVEPESILRALAFARHCRKPTIVGGHMFDLLDRPVMHAFAEIVDEVPFIWQTQFKDLFPHDFRVSNLRQTRLLHARMDSDYNGWWFCLIPTRVVREVGLALPAFIKWDDAEYCLRAREHGYLTVSLPGAALWHVSWIDKDDAIDWQAYFHARNRFVAALLHSPFPRGGKILKDSKRQDLKNLLSMQYYAATLRHEALSDILKGPEHLHATVATKLAALREQAAGFREKRVLRGDGELPLTNEGKKVYPPPRGTKQAKGPRGVPLIVYTARQVFRHWMTKPDPRNVERPQTELAKRDATWFRLPLFDSALVTTADGAGKVWYLRERSTFRRLLRQGNRLHRRIGRNWESLAREYREALPEITSPEAWRKTFER